MRPPPAIAREEPPLEVLAGTHRQPVEVATGHVDADDPGPLVDDVGDPKLMTHGRRDGVADAEDEHEPDRDQVEPDPVQRRDLVVHEVGADEELMQEPERDREIGIEMDAVPRLAR